MLQWSAYPDAPDILLVTSALPSPATIANPLYPAAPARAAWLQCIFHNGTYERWRIPHTEDEDQWELDDAGTLELPPYQNEGPWK